MPTAQGYSRLHIALHWLVVALIVPQFLFNETIAEAFDATLEGRVADPGVLGPLHVLCGMAIVIAVVWRIGLRVKNGVPEAPAAESAVQKMIATGTHLGLYLVLLLTAASGSVAWFGGVETAGDVHEAMTTVLLILIGLHVAGALYQQFVLKTNIMDRMRTPRV
jgi:cytochrome b561